MVEVADTGLLTPRQLEVLELMARGLTNKEIAGVLGIAPGTAKIHVSAVIAALDVTNRTEAAVALRDLRRDEGAPTTGGAVVGFGERPALAVLPFDNLSADPEHSHFADALVEDLTTRLASWRWFPVIARNTSFALRGRPIVATAVSRELGARYLIEGSTRRSGDRVRINVQLIDGEHGRHVLAERYDRRVADVFAVQDEIVDSIVGALEPALLRVEGMRALHKPPAHLDAWEAFQRGMILLSQQSREATAEGLSYFERATESDPEFAPAHSGRALALYSLALLEVGATQLADDGTAASPEQVGRALLKAQEHFAGVLAAGRRALELDPLDSAAHLAVGAGLATTGDIPGALPCLDRAVELNPSSAYACFASAVTLGWTDRWHEGFDLVTRAIRLSPADPVLHHFEGLLSLLHLRAGRMEEALPMARRSLQHQTPGAFGYRPVIPAALAFLGRMDEARAECEAMRAARPGFNLALARVLAPAELVDRLAEGVRLAGWDVPEH